jgi:hypothetical protein
VAVIALSITSYVYTNFNKETATTTTATGEVALMKYLKFVKSQLANEKYLQRHLGPGRGAIFYNASSLPLLRGFKNVKKTTPSTAI